MSDGLKIALIVAVGLIAAVAIYVYFSAFQTCVRARAASSEESGTDPADAVRYAQHVCSLNSN